MIQLAIAVVAMWLAAATVYHLAAQWSLRRLLSSRASDATKPLPSAAILRPLDDDAPIREDDLATLCAQRARVVVGIQSETSIAGAALARLARREGFATLEVVAGTAPQCANHKVGKLLAMMPRAREEITVLVDGDVAIPPGYLEAILAPFEDPRVGLVTCPYRSVGGSSLPARLDVILTNAGFLPSVALAARFEGVRFALGATIAVRRRVLEEIGGLESVRDVLADDWAIAQRVIEAGHRIALAPLLLDHHVADSQWSSVLQRHLRWARTVRIIRPAGYAGTIVAHGWVPALVLAAAFPSAVAFAALAAYAAARIGGTAWNRRRTGLTARDLALLPLVDTISASIFAAGLVGTTVRWGGTPLVLRRDGSIEAAD